MHATIRRWTGASKLIDEMQHRSQDVQDIISGSPGFISYHAVRSGDTLTSVTVCEDKAGTDESTRRAGEWVRQNLPADVLAGLKPEVADGDAFLSFGAP